MLSCCWGAVMSKGSGFGPLLRVNPLFADLGPEVIDCLAEMATTRMLRAGEMLFQVGDPGDTLYGIRRGEIRIETGTEAGRRIVLNSLGAGDLFGEIALLDGHERTADAVAAVASEVFVLRRSDLLAYLTREPDVAIRLIGLLCSRIRYIAGQMNELATLSLGARLARRLTVLAEDFGNEIQISQEQLGAFVGGTRESVNRQLQVWRRAGYIDLRRGCVVVLDGEALTRMAQESSCA
jgi:CRP/FNR family transcriptional regulator, cyclic AMP receptor protein